MLYKMTPPGGWGAFSLAKLLNKVVKKKKIREIYVFWLKIKENNGKKRK